MKRVVLLLVIAIVGTPAIAAREYFVVLASFAQESAARAVAEEVALAGNVSATLKQATIATGPRYRVVAGPFSTSQEARSALTAARDSGFDSAWTYEAESESSPVIVAASPQDSNDVQQAPRQPIMQRRGIPADLNRGVVPVLREDVIDAMSRTRRQTDEQVLPPLETQQGPRISQQDQVQLASIEVVTPILKREIDALTAPYEGRAVAVEELFALRNQINQLCVTEGYINSGVVIPDQEIKDGVLRMEMIAGEISRVNVKSRLRERYVAKRIDIAQPFNLVELQSSLKLLEKNRLVNRIHARVEPGERPGSAHLDLDVETMPFYRLGIIGANNRSPSIGAEYGELYFQAEDLLTTGDTLFLSGSGTQGLTSHKAEWRIPFNRFDHALILGHSVTDSTVVEEPFNTVDIESETEAITVGLRFPVRRTVSSELAVEIIGEKRRNLTTLLGLPFSFSEGAINGESRVTPLRLAISYVRQGAAQSFAVRLAASHGLSSFDATSNATVADGKFDSYLLQLQYSRQLFENFYVTSKALAQVASDPLLSVEKFALGGLDTVRGYRENQVVRDNAYFASIEGRYRFNQMGRLELVSFLDYGAGKNDGEALVTGRDSISSVGVGLSWRNLSGLNAELYWAHAFKDVVVQGHDLQDDGIHFRMSYEYAF